ncbi:MAG: tryptophan--tRNA ligase, partial [Burkholderiales bacterium]
MYTDPNHIRVSDPGQVAGNMVFTYLDAFDKDKLKVAELKDHYSRGGLGDVSVKKYLLEIMESILAPIRYKREQLAQDKTEVLNILNTGSQAAREVAAATLSQVRQAIGVNFFHR